MIEGGDLLDGDLLARGLVERRADNAISALANYVLDVILLGYIEGDFPGATAPGGCARHGLEYDALLRW